MAFFSEYVILHRRKGQTKKDSGFFIPSRNPQALQQRHMFSSSNIFNILNVYTGSKSLGTWINLPKEKKRNPIISYFCRDLSHGMQMKTGIMGCSMTQGVTQTVLAAKCDF